MTSLRSRKCPASGLRRRLAGREGKLIDTSDFSERWNNILPNSVIGGLSKIACSESTGVLA